MPNVQRAFRLDCQIFQTCSLFGIRISLMHMHMRMLKTPGMFGKIKIHSVHLSQLIARRATNPHQTKLIYLSICFPSSCQCQSKRACVTPLILLIRVEMCYISIDSEAINIPPAYACIEMKHKLFSARMLPISLPIIVSFPSQNIL